MRGHDGAFPPCPSKRGATGAEVPLHKCIIGDFIIVPDRLETNLLQLFTYTKNSKCFSLIYVIIFEVNIVAEQKW